MLHIWHATVAQQYLHRGSTIQKSLCGTMWRLFLKSLGQSLKISLTIAITEVICPTIHVGHVWDKIDSKSAKLLCH